MGEHYFTNAPSVPSRPSSTRLQLGDLDLELATDTGVFSADRVDPGTIALLKESGPPPATGDILDLGCGYGPIACAVAKRSPSARVWAVDVNERARQLAAANAKSCHAPNVQVMPPQSVPAGLRFAAVYSNPPIRVGKEALHALLGTWLTRLDAGGVAWLVVNRHLGADTLAAWLSTQGFDVRRQASKSGYRVLRVAHTSCPAQSSVP